MLRAALQTRSTALSRTEKGNLSLHMQSLCRLPLHMRRRKLIQISGRGCGVLLEFWLEGERAQANGVSRVCVGKNKCMSSQCDNIQ